MRVLFFGRLREAAGCAELNCTPTSQVQTVGALRDWLAQRDPILDDALRQPGMRVALDQSFCSLDTVIADASEIAFMSPLSGG